MNYTTLTYELSDGIATITLKRPDAANAVNPAMARELNLVSIECDRNPLIRAVVVTGSGKMFCAGGDLGEFVKAGDNAPHLLSEMTGDLHLAISRFTRMNAPVIAKVNGTAAGAGLSLVAACDLAVSVDSAKFVMAYTNAGLSPDGSSTYFLPRRIGDRRARELMLTNRVLSASEAVQWGILNQAVGADELDDVVAELAASIAAGPTLSFGKVKTLLNQSFDNGLETQMELESRAISDSSRTRDGQEGMNAFVEKRKPTFTGE